MLSPLCEAAIIFAYPIVSCKPQRIGNGFIVLDYNSGYDERGNGEGVAQWVGSGEATIIITTANNETACG